MIYLKYVLGMLCFMSVLCGFMLGMYTCMDVVYGLFKQHMPDREAIMYTTITTMALFVTFWGLLMAWISKQAWSKKTVSF